MNATKIDWINHGIAFAASVIGIFIAFQLDDWQERRARREALDIALVGIKAEIEGNLAVYQRNDTVLQKFVDYMDFYRGHLNNGTLLCSQKEFDDARKVNPERFEFVRLISHVNDTVSRYSAPFNIDVIPSGDVTTGNWEAARSSGVLAYLDHEQVALLSQVYDWTTRRLGVSDEEFSNNFVTLNEFDNMDKILDDYELIAKASRLKYKSIKRYYDQIKW